MKCFCLKGFLDKTGCTIADLEFLPNPSRGNGIMILDRKNARIYDAESCCDKIDDLTEVHI